MQCKITLPKSCLVCFLASYVPKQYNTYKTPVMEKLKNIIKNVYFECFFRFLCTETGKSMKITLYSDIKRYYHKRVLQMLLAFLVNKTLKRMHTITNLETKYYKKPAFWMLRRKVTKYMYRVYERARNQNLKKNIVSILYGKIKQN